MSFVSEFKNKILSINEENFIDSSLEIFNYQFSQNPVYKQYCQLLKKTPESVKTIKEIPFIPIEFFKNHAITSSRSKAQKVFLSSGTTSSDRSKHYIPDLSFYHKVAKSAFELFFGKLSNKRLIALLPSYLEQGDSSLINMIDSFMQISARGSDYFLNQEIEHELAQSGPKVIFGVSYALLDLRLKRNPDETIIIETGGMKGRKKEITREELHDQIAKNTSIKEIWSEYGMTELQSQAYGINGDFSFPNWAKTLIREINDPFSYLEDGKTGGINVIDLANIETCSFIETKDLGKTNQNGTFQVLGRFDNSDIRGCNLLV